MQISLRKVENSISGGPNKSERLENFLKKVGGDSYSGPYISSSDYSLHQVCQSQIHRGPKKEIGYNPRAGLVQCLLKHIEMNARSLLNQDLTQCII